MSTTFDFEKYTGKKVRVAILDTGLDITHPIFSTCSSVEIIQIVNDGNKNIALPISGLENDPIGHGTACAGIIHKKARDAHITMIRCIEPDLTSNPLAVLYALEWCIEQQFNVVNISMGTFSDMYNEKFERLGRIAISKNILLVAASDESGYACIPARLPEYIGVAPGRIVGEYEYYRRDNEINFICNGTRQRLAWKNKKTIFLNGSSFAAAHMTGMIACIKEAYPVQSYSFIMNLLNENACPYIPPVQYKIQETTAYCANSRPFSMKKVVLFPFNKEMHAILRYSDLCNFEVVGVADVAYKRMCGKDPYAAIGMEKSNIRISSDLDAELEKADTLVLSKCSLLSSIAHTDYQLTAMQKAIRHHANVFSLDYTDNMIFPEVYREAKEEGVYIRHPMLGESDIAYSRHIKENYGHISNTVPILGIFGTGTSQGKFTLQLLLRRLFISRGYNVANIGSETHAELFGFESICPMEIQKSICFDKGELMTYLQGEVRSLELHQPRYDIIIAGAQSGLVPKSFAFSTDTYTIPSIAFLLGVLPHYYILTVNVDDELQYIQDTLDALRILGKGDVICLSFLPIKKDGEKNKVLDISEIKEISRKLEDAFSIPAIDMASSQGQERLFKVLLQKLAQ